MLTEINGRPLNLFFKENEIRDRLNAVGRDISILVCCYWSVEVQLVRYCFLTTFSSVQVQPADLVTKLKKQLKSLRGHKDFIVQ